jgi:hypothetical protein
MRGVVYCGSMGEWPLPDDAQRQEGVRRLVEAGVPVVVGTGAQSPARPRPTPRTRGVGAQGLMVIPRVLSRGTSTRAQRDHIARVLGAAPGLPAVIYNSPYYGYETGPELFFELRRDHPNLVGFKEFGGAAALTRAAEHITHADDELLLLVGVDTQVFHGFVRCGAVGAITGVGNCLPAEVLGSSTSAAAPPPATPRRRASPASSTTRCTCSPPSTRAPTWSSTTSTWPRSWDDEAYAHRSTPPTRSRAPAIQRYGEGDDDERRRPYLTWGALVPHVVRAP